MGLVGKLLFSQKLHFSVMQIAEINQSYEVNPRNIVKTL